MERVMKRRKTLVRAVQAAIAALLLASVPFSMGVGDAAAANVYYVAPTGNDGAAGTQSAPWASITRAQAAAQPGDTVYLRGGTYSFTRANSAGHCAGPSLMANKSARVGTQPSPRTAGR
jgi:hypothetical protein